MKKYLLIIFLLIISFICRSEEKHALIIAIAAYDSNLTGWYPISADNDIPLIKNSLLNLGFKEENIILLQDSDATKEGIVNAFEKLYSRVGEGDMVVFHYSGHGHQIFDDNGDEIDGLDEALVSFDAPMKMYEGYDGSAHLRDDELGIILNRIRLRAGPAGHVLVFLDSCHSGTGTRGTAKARGGAPPLVPENWSPMPKVDEKIGFGLNPNNMLSRGQADNMAKFVVISGASANELNYETYDDSNQPVGSLSYSIFKAFTQIKPNETYRQVYARIVAEMASKAPMQNPAIEGDIDYEVFGGNFVTQSEYFNLNAIKSKTEIEINGGMLVGIHPGSVVAFAKPGTTSLGETEKIMYRGVVSIASNFSSIVTLESEHKFKTTADAWAFIQSRALPESRLKVAIDPSMDENAKKQLVQKIEDGGIAEVSNENPDVKIDFSKTRGAAVVSIKNTAYNNELHRIADRNEAHVLNETANMINNYAQGNIIRNLNFYNENYDLILELVPIEAEIKDNTFRIKNYLDPKDFLDENNTMSFTTDDFALIKVINYGTKKAYFNIVDIQPNGIVNPIIPMAHELDGREYYVEPGDSAILTNILVMFGPPYGNEVFKIIASDKPFNLTASLTQNSTATRGAANNIFESAVSLGRNNVNTRGASTMASKKQEDRISTFEFAFRIREGKK